MPSPCDGHCDSLERTLEAFVDEALRMDPYNQ
jgi:hypothetical protein